jgi:hypothetical protein
VPYVEVWFGNVLGTCCNKLLGTYALGSLYTIVCGVTALVVAIVLTPPAEAPIVVRYGCVCGGLEVHQWGL